MSQGIAHKIWVMGAHVYFMHLNLLKIISTSFDHFALVS